MPRHNIQSPSGSNMSSVKEKGLRKGTKSCIECRKRKVKCIFRSDNSDQCVSCIARGAKCTLQSKSRDQLKVPVSNKATSPTATLEERVAQLETLLKLRTSGEISIPSHEGVTSSHGSQGSSDVIGTRQDNLNRSGYGQQSPTELFQEHALSSAGDLQDLDSAQSLFNNALWKQDDLHQEPVASPSVITATAAGLGALDDESCRVCSQLRRGLPPLKLLSNIIKATDSWWYTWRAVGDWFRDLMTQESIYTLQEAITWTLSSNEPPVVAIGILFIAICLQQLDNRTHEHLIKQLPQPPGELFQELFDRVQRLIVNNNGYSTSQAGIEVLMTSAKICMNLGLLKMCWILNHRAVSHAQLLGLHQPRRILSDDTESSMVTRHETWLSLCVRDLYTSLLLGLPNSANWKSILPVSQSVDGTYKFFEYHLMRLSAQIIDRNLMGLEVSITETRDIERNFDSIASELPAGHFWDAPAALHSGQINRTEYMNRLASQFWFFQAKVLLYQPLMILSIENHQLLDYQKACLTASRSTLKIYHLMCSDRTAAFSMVKLVDYQAFICSVILLLGLLGYGSLNPPTLISSTDQNHDLETVQTTLDILRRTSGISNNTIASQAVQGLETLIMLVQCGVTGACRTSNQQPVPSQVKITVPGSGVITLSPGKLMPKPISSTLDPTVYPPVTFHLTHDTFQSPSGVEMSQQITQGTEANTWTGSDLELDISMMDLDWSNMIGTDLLDDWAWLADIDAGGVM